MRLFTPAIPWNEVDRALDGGEQVLRICQWHGRPGSTPICAMLLDRDRVRLVETAERYRVRDPLVCNCDGPRQHVLVYGEPLIWMAAIAVPWLVGDAARMLTFVDLAAGSPC